MAPRRSLTGDPAVFDRGPTETPLLYKALPVRTAGGALSNAFPFEYHIHAMDIVAADLNLLKAFNALYTQRAVTRAAGRIGLSQPAMSHALSRLRELFADELFVRTSDGMIPTERAHDIASLVTAALVHIDSALNLGTAFDPATSIATFTAGMGEYSQISLIGGLAKGFSCEAPRATLRLLPSNGNDAADQLERGEIDVAVAPLGPMPSEIKTAPLFQDPVVVVVRKGHPLSKGPLTLDDYAECNHLLVSPRGHTSGTFDRVLFGYGKRRRIVLLVASYLAVPNALASSDLLASVPSRVAALIAMHGDLIILPLPVDFYTSISIAWHGRTETDPRQIWFRDMLKAAAGERNANGLICAS